MSDKDGTLPESILKNVLVQNFLHVVQQCGGVLVEVRYSLRPKLIQPRSPPFNDRLEIRDVFVRREAIYI